MWVRTESESARNRSVEHASAIIAGAIFPKIQAMYASDTNPRGTSQRQIVVVPLQMTNQPSFLRSYRINHSLMCPFRGGDLQERSLTQDSSRSDGGSNITNDMT